MSVSKLSDTLQRQILERLITNVSKDLAIAQSLEKQIKYDFKSSTVTSMIRDITDRNQIGILHRDTVNALSKIYSEINIEQLKRSGRLFSKDNQIAKGPGLRTLKKALQKAMDTGGEVEAQLLINNIGKTINSVLLAPTFWEDLEKDLISKKILDENSLSDTYLQLIPSYHGTFLKIFIDKVSVNNALVKDFLSATLDTGHLVGIFNQRLSRSLGISNIVYKDNVVGNITATILEEQEKDSADEIKKLNATYTAALGILEQLDYLSSNLVFDPDLFIKLSKVVYGSESEPKAVAEFQFSFHNSDAGRQISAAGKQLSTIMEKAVSDRKNKRDRSISFDSENPSSIDFAKTLEDMFIKIGLAGSTISSTIDSLIKTSQDKAIESRLLAIKELASTFTDTLIRAKGSDSIVDSIGKSIVSILSNKKLPNRQQTGVTKTYKGKNTNKKSSKRIETKTKIQRYKQKNPRLELPKTVVRTLKGRFYSLANLQFLMDTMLADTIKNNMGSGDRRDILNLRTGRFAESAKVTRFSTSREGMITAFYTYMKNPYATFEPGGAQGSPRSRDPKLLISKSIREVAASKVSNRLRAVLV